MAIEDIVAMGATVKQRAARDSMLFLWVTWPFLNRADEVANAWGFRYSSNAWTWVKGEVEEQSPVVSMNGLAYPVPPALKLRHGRGHTTRKATEVCLLYRRGNGVPRASMSVSDVILEAPDGRHSRKPEEQYRRIEEFLGPGLRRLEMFARPPARAANWAVWGNES